jgi:dolichyl-phosphate-mannose-protein mannosyltransferase
VLRRLTPALAIAGLAGALWLIFPFGFPNYDTVYALVWGQELADGINPDYGAPIPPTPHPLADLWGALTAFLGDGAGDATTVVAYLALAATGYLVYRLGELWFDRWIGLAAAANVLTRAPFLSNGLRAYVDIPYIALCLAALVVETRRPRAGWPVLVLLSLAGLLRPEAWLFAVAYLAYLAWGQGLDRRRLAWLATLALSAPLIWAAFDWITADSPTYSLTGTQDTVDTLGRDSGPVDLVLYGPRRLGEVLQWPGMVGAAGGLALALGTLRSRALLGAAAAALALLAFALLGSAGLAIIPRYTMLAAAVLAVFCAAGLLGWRLLDPGDPWRRRWQLFAGLVAVMFVVWGPNQYDLLDNVYVDINDQSTVESDLKDLADSGAFDGGCLPISVPNHRAVPRLAMWLDLRPSQIVSSSEEQQPSHGYFIAPANEFTVENFILDPNDPARLEVEVPPGFLPVPVENASWLLYSRC